MSDSVLETESIYGISEDFSHETCSDHETFVEDSENNRPKLLPATVSSLPPAHHIPDIVLPCCIPGPKLTSVRSRKKNKKANNTVLEINPECISASIKNGLYKPSKAETDAFMQLRKIFSEAVQFRDYYFDFFPVDRAVKRAHDVGEIVGKSLESITKLGNLFKPRNLPWFFAYRALCLSVDSLRVKEAHDELQFAVRHLAHFPALWIALGESHWEQGDYYMAVACFEKAAMLDASDVVPLVKLSCSMRLLLGKETDSTERLKMLLRMVSLAKDAVARCPDSGDTWYNLGTSLLVYFSAKAQSDLILESLAAFEKASSCRILLGKAEFHYNYGTANILYGNYQEAIDMWLRASALEPDWDKPKEKLVELVKYLTFISDLVTGKDRTFRRRVKQLAESVPRKNLSSILVDPASPRTAYKIVSVKTLSVGQNAGLMAHGKIYATTYQTPDPSRLIFLIDSTGEAIPVIIYHMGIEFSVGGSVSIPDPFVRLVRLVHNHTDICFRYIRVDEPWRMFHNLIRVPRKQCASTVVLTTPVSNASH
ncbi:putative Tetratricopeptide repeat protein 5 [Hypsibius exemplaris]|uniref:Tetratricopeptide repeat protein 5 n=1 Tax=Hypsibius exemplaris TaxID=2072580 RepID=A0A1W0WN28_HYPEX|nr:putative Tetratricopeptide repeat protein 5 [Hypsibius exemplaris]